MPKISRNTVIMYAIIFIALLMMISRIFNLEISGWDIILGLLKAIGFTAILLATPYILYRWYLGKAILPSSGMITSKIGKRILDNLDNLAILETTSILFILILILNLLFKNFFGKVYYPYFWQFLFGNLLLAYAIGIWRKGKPLGKIVAIVVVLPLIVILFWAKHVDKQGGDPVERFQKGIENFATSSPATRPPKEKVVPERKPYCTLIANSETWTETPKLPSSNIMIEEDGYVWIQVTTNSNPSKPKIIKDGPEILNERVQDIRTLKFLAIDKKQVRVDIYID